MKPKESEVEASRPQGIVALLRISLCPMWSSALAVEGTQVAAFTENECSGSKGGGEAAAAAQPLVLVHLLRPLHFANSNSARTESFHWTQLSFSLSVQKSKSYRNETSC